MPEFNISKTCCGALCRCSVNISISGCLILFFWLIFQPHEIRANVNTATLSSFTINDTVSAHSLAYNLNLTLSLRNPNRRIRIYYYSLSASAFYNGTQLGPKKTNFSRFFQHTKSTTIVYPAFTGNQDNLKNGVRDEFNKEKLAGTYNIEVKLNTKLCYMLWFVPIRGFKPKIDCTLRFPVMPGGNVSTAPFTKCHVDY